MFQVDASTPVITQLYPPALPSGAEATVTKDVGFSVVNLAWIAVTVDYDAIVPLTAVVNGSTVTVTSPPPTTTSDPILRTMNV